MVPFVLTSPRTQLPTIFSLFASSVILIEIPNSSARFENSSSVLILPEYKSDSNSSNLALSPKYPIFLLSPVITHPFLPMYAIIKLIISL